MSAGARWAVRLSTGRRDVVARLRGHPGVQLLETIDAAWLRGSHRDDALTRALDALPGGERFDVDDDGCCRVPGHHLPTAVLPGGRWVDLREAVPVELPAAGLPGGIGAPVVLTIVRGGVVGDGNVLHTTARQLAEWLERAAEVRYASLRFAASSDGSVLVHGRPLPPVAGAVAIESEGVAVPAGHRLDPDLPPALARAVLGLRDGDLAWFSRNGSWVHIAAAAFVTLRRSSLRRTLAELDS